MSDVLSDIVDEVNLSPSIKKLGLNPKTATRVLKLVHREFHEGNIDVGDLVRLYLSSLWSYGNGIPLPGGFNRNPPLYRNMGSKCVLLLDDFLRVVKGVVRVDWRMVHLPSVGVDERRVFENVSLNYQTGFSETAGIVGVYVSNNLADEPQLVFGRSCDLPDTPVSINDSRASRSKPGDKIIGNIQRIPVSSVITYGKSRLK